MKLGSRFFISWILSAITMFTLFYIWHGIFLNDFKRIQFPLTWFVTFAAFTYLIFGAGIFFLYESQVMKWFDNLWLRGIVCGLIAGFSFFMIATIVNISITSNLSKQHLLVDCAWQMAEQTVGALTIVFLKFVIRERIPEEI
ncbi:MAG: hypothetical protein K0S32_3312 [Bacteroidetes bacterium]|jgi:hypothetical protein|nr:hypothetical protein [Bacteroidota bacterium]